MDQKTVKIIARGLDKIIWKNLKEKRRAALRERT